MSSKSPDKVPPDRGPEDLTSSQSPDDVPLDCEPEGSKSSGVPLAIIKFSPAALEATFSYVPCDKYQKNRTTDEGLVLASLPGPRDSEEVLVEDDPPFPFQKLAAELRNEIYHYVLISATDIVPKKRLTKAELRALPRRKELSVERRVEPKPGSNRFPRSSLLLVSRQIYNETVAIYYYHNQFCFRDMGILANFLEHIGPDRRSFLTKISTVWEGKGAPKAFKLLAQCERLNSLRLWVNENTLSGARYHIVDRNQTTSVKKLLHAPGFNYLLKVNGLEKLYITDLETFRYGEEEGFIERLRTAFGQGETVVADNRTFRRRNYVKGKLRDFYDWENSEYSTPCIPQ